MNRLKNRTINEYGITTYNETGLFEKLFSGESIANVIAEPTDEILKFEDMLSKHGIKSPLEFFENPGISPKEYFQACQSSWLIPDEHANIDLLDLLIKSCNSTEEEVRIAEEWLVFESIGWIPVLKQLHYLVSTMRKNDVVWGVGRGSSVCSFILYKLGVHKINSLKFNLTLNEFIKSPKS